MTHSKPLSLILILSSLSTINYAQQFIGLATGNYGGVNSLTLNPSSIADNRYKFDINLFSTSSYFDNNLVNIKRDAFFRGQFFKSPYNNNYAAVRKDLLSLQNKPANERVNGLSDTRILAPLSAMITTGKKSAIGITFQSRAGFQTYNLARNTAQLLYEELNNPSLNGLTENNSGIESNYLRWQEVGFTYARVLLNSGVHFLKAGVTGKWLMGQAGAYIQSDNLNVTFNSQTELSLRSPLIKYYRSEQADINQFNTNTFFKDIEDHGFGWDAGITYEFRGNFEKFTYKGVNNEMRGRRDMNKYSIRLAAAIMDAGSLQFTKQPFTDDHSANFTNWNFEDLKANSIANFDTAYAKQVQYANGTDENFRVAMPTALSANIDIRIHRGFYINAATYKPLRNFNNNTQSGMRPVEWFAVTPRFESRYFGLYVPITMTNLHERTDVGLTLRAGPLFIGSNNLGSYLFNEQLPSVDVHAGVKVGITYGKPSRLLKSLEKLRLSALQKDSSLLRDSLIKMQTVNLLESKYMRTIDSLKAITDSITLRNTIMAELAKADSLKNPIPQEKTVPAVNIIINNYLPTNQDSIRRYQSRIDTLVVDNRLIQSAAITNVNAVSTRQLDSILRQKESEVDYLLRQNAQQSLMLFDMGTLRKEDSIMLNKLQQDRKRLENLLTDSLSKWRQQFTPVPLKQAPAKKERKSIFKGNRDNVNATQPQQQTYAALPFQPDASLNRDVDNQQSKADLRAIQRSNNDLELEMQNLRRSMAANTAMLTTAMVANSAAMSGSAKRTAAESNVSNAPIITKANVQPVLVMKTTDTSFDIVSRNNTMMVQKADTVFVRDTIFLPGMPMAIMPMNVVNPVYIRDTTVIIKKKVELDTPPAEISVYFSSGSTSLSLDAKKMIEKWSHAASTFRTAYQIYLVGRTDATGSKAINKRVAQSRINTVSNFLTLHGVDKKNIGSSITLAPNGSSGSNPMNRRVDVKMVTLIP